MRSKEASGRSGAGPRKQLALKVAAKKGRKKQKASVSSNRSAERSPSPPPHAATAEYDRAVPRDLYGKLRVESRAA
jgi:hypothetical protein